MCRFLMFCFGAVCFFIYSCQVYAVIRQVAARTRESFPTLLASCITVHWGMATERRRRVIG